MNANLDHLPRGRPKTVSAEERKQRHTEYMRRYYAENKDRMNANARRAYMRLKQRNMPAEPVHAPAVGAQ